MNAITNYRLHTYRAVISVTIILVLSLPGCGGGGEVAVPAMPAPAPGILTGRAINPSTGAPIANFTVTTDTNQTITVVNSGDGSFVLNNVPAGVRTVTITAPSFMPMMVQVIVVSNEVSRLGNLVATPAVDAPPNPPPGF